MVLIFPQTLNKILFKNQVDNDKHGFLSPLYKISLSLTSATVDISYLVVPFITFFSPYAIKSAAKGWLEAILRCFRETDWLASQSVYPHFLAGETGERFQLHTKAFIFLNKFMMSVD